MITESTIREAYLHLRKTNSTIPDETLDFMLEASLEKLKRGNIPDVWVKGNIIRVTTVCNYWEKWGDDDYVESGQRTYEGEVIEVDKGLALKTKEGIFKTQGSYWFGSILKQGIELIKSA